MKKNNQIKNRIKIKRALTITILLITICIIICVTFKEDKYEYLENYFTSKEINFVKNNKLDYSDFSSYLNYDSFEIEKYYEYEKLRKNGNYLEAINLFNYPFYYDLASSYILTNPALQFLPTLVLVNKHYYVPSDYSYLEFDKVENYNIKYIKRTDEEMTGASIALKKLEEMATAATLDNINLLVYSAYRSYEKQEYLYYTVHFQNDDYSAKPGYSEHHTGLAFDISDETYGLTLALKDSPTYTWLLNNCYKYGFILRYPHNKEEITLYRFEPWHFRYVGVSTSTFIHNNNLTLEEYIIQNYEFPSP